MEAKPSRGDRDGVIDKPAGIKHGTNCYSVGSSVVIFSLSTDVGTFDLLLRSDIGPSLDLRYTAHGMPAAMVSASPVRLNSAARMFLKG
jgi:hypothetical protein